MSFIPVKSIREVRETIIGFRVREITLRTLNREEPQKAIMSFLPIKSGQMGESQGNTIKERTCSIREVWETIISFGVLETTARTLSREELQKDIMSFISVKV